MSFIKKLIIIMLFCIANTAYASALDNIPVAKMKIEFLKLYREQWKVSGTEALLNQIIDEAIEEQTADLMWGTAWWQLANDSGGIIGKIQEAAIFKFAPGYEKFLDEFRELFGDMLRREILNFYEEQSTKFLSIEQNPMVQANIKQDYDSVVSTQGVKLTNAISQRLAEQHNITLTGAKLGAGLFLKFGIQALGKQFATKAGGALLTKIGGSAVGTAFQTLSGPIGWALLAWTAYDVMDMAFSSKKEVRKQLHEMNQTSFTSTIPLEQWDAMEPYVRDSFAFTYERLQNKVKRAVDIQNDIVIKQLYSSMNKDQTNFFSTRVAILESALEDYTGDKENIFKYFGEAIRDVSIKNFGTFISMLREGDWENLSEWIDFAGLEECCNRYNKTSEKFWMKLPGRGQADLETAAPAKTAAEVRTPTQATSVLISEAETKTEIKANAEAETKVETKTENEVKAETETETQAKAETKAETETKVEAEAETKTQAKAETKAETKTQAKAETKAETETKAEVETEVKAETESAANISENSSAKPSPLLDFLSTEEGHITAMAAAFLAGALIAFIKFRNFRKNKILRRI